jgi:hypothetical protein
VKELKLNSLKKILETDAEVIRNKEMVSIHMSEKNYERFKEEIPEVAVIKDGDVRIKARIECENPDE